MARIFEKDALYAAPAEKSEMPDDWEYVMRDRYEASDAKRVEYVDWFMSYDDTYGVDREYAWGGALNEHFDRLRAGGQPGI